MICYECGKIISDAYRPMQPKYPEGYQLWKLKKY
jgi:DNA-directed RNA polymerase subunit N (RpoN/RPB10)